MAKQRTVRTRGDRDLMTVEALPATFQVIRRLASDAGMKQKAHVGRVLDWFAQLRPIEQALIVTPLHGDVPDLVDLLMRRWLAEHLDQKQAAHSDVYRREIGALLSDVWETLPPPIGDASPAPASSSAPTNGDKGGKRLRRPLGTGKRARVAS